MKAKNSLGYIEWISYDEFENIVLIEKGSLFCYMEKYMLTGKIERSVEKLLLLKNVVVIRIISQGFLRKLNAHLQYVTSHMNEMEDKVFSCFDLSQSSRHKSNRL